MALSVEEFKKKVAEDKKNPPVRESSEDSLDRMADELEKLEELPTVDGFVFLAGVPRRLGLRKR